MPKLVVRSFAISLDGFSAAPGQSQEAPFGKDGLRLLDWFFPTRYFHTMTGQEGGEENLDNEFVAKSDENIGAGIMGRHMFGPPQDAKDKEHWQGWWGGPIRPITIPSSCLPTRRRSLWRWREARRFTSSTTALNRP